ncbi:hypothetical protein MRX96_008968 [Rhipicephalus microplus]
MVTFTSPSQRTPRVKHRRHVSLSHVVRMPSTLDEELSAGIKLEQRSQISLDEWLHDLDAIGLTHPALSSRTLHTTTNPPATCALAEPPQRNCSSHSTELLQRSFTG